MTAPQDNVTQLTERKLWLPPGGWVDTVTGTEILSPEHGAETPFLRHLILKMIILPRHARDKHRESTQKRE